MTTTTRSHLCSGTNIHSEIDKLVLFTDEIIGNERLKNLGLMLKEWNLSDDQVTAVADLVDRALSDAVRLCGLYAGLNDDYQKECDELAEKWQSLKEK